MSKTNPKGTLRLEMWLPNQVADYATQVAISLKMRRKILLEKVVSDYLDSCRNKIPYVTQNALPFLNQQVKKAIAKKTKISSPKKLPVKPTTVKKRKIATKVQKKKVVLKNKSQR